jgi:hypothetical protein
MLRANQSEDKRISETIESSVAFLEDRTNSTIAKTEVTQTITDFNADNVWIYEAPLISILGVSGDTGSLSYTLNKVEWNKFQIKLSTTVSASTLTVKYRLGYDTGQIPVQLKKAILLQVNSFYDELSGEYVQGAWKKSDAIEKLIERFVNYNL